MNANSYKQLEERDDYIGELRKQLAASQAREQQLLEGLLFAKPVVDAHGSNIRIVAVNRALSLASDTTALESLIQKAGEVMRERCSKVADWQAEGWSAAIEIRSIPAITLTDLK